MNWIFLIVLAALVIIVACIYLLVNTTNGQIKSTGRLRKYLLYVPESYNPSVPTPLVLCFHGFVQWPAHLMQTSQWNELADEHGFIVIYPSGTGFPLHWNILNWPGPVISPSNEVQFISDLIDRLEKQYNIDSKRIYANGLSNGGGMSFLLACQLSERITAVGSVAGAYLLADCQPTRLVPAILFHGTTDRIVPYHGRAAALNGSTFPDIAAFASMWAGRIGCDPTPVELPTQGDVSGVHYVHSSEEADVIFYTINGGGHGWPGGKPIPKILARRSTQDIDATRVMWEFFSQYALEG